jgi:hypothetical protein
MDVRINDIIYFLDTFLASHSLSYWDCAIRPTFLDFTHNDVRFDYVYPTWNGKRYVTASSSCREVRMHGARVVEQGVRTGIFIW